jgi:subtilisin family serine protease
VTILGYMILSACGGGVSSPAPPLPPNVTASVSASSGAAPLAVSFNASASTDPQQLPLTFTWNFGDGSAAASGPIVSHLYNNHGAYVAAVTVTNGQATSRKALPITVNPAPPNVQSLSFPINLIGVATSNATAQLVATDRENLSLTYSLTTPPPIGTATINGSTGAITYSLPGFVGENSTSFIVTVANFGASATSSVFVQIDSDPLLPNQWHIQNTGQNAFSSTYPVAGNDMNVAGAWSAGYSGKGIKVGIVDTGLEAAHEDLQANVDLPHSINFSVCTNGSNQNCPNDPTPTFTGFDHGTAVAGIVGAVAFNGKGGRGVAYDVTLRGYNLLATGNFSLQNEVVALGGTSISADNDIFNLSFEGNSTNTSGSDVLPSSSAFENAIAASASLLRGGLGASFVVGAGNDFQDFEYGPSAYCVTYANAYAVSCGDSASDPRRSEYYPIIVGAISAAGTHSSYSSTGSSLWISAPGGEYGYNSSIAGANYAAVDYEPALITTNLDGCANARDPKPVNALDDQGANPLSANCQYTATMNGTSAATPNTSGTVALMLQANPKLSVRDIKYILAKTATRVDSMFGGVSSTTFLPGSNVVFEQGWTTNAAGYSFANRYGFGEVNAAAAVAMAQSYSSYLPQLQTSTGSYAVVAVPPGLVPAASTTGTSISVAVNEPFQTVEFAVATVNVATTPLLPCNQITLTSPSGTQSILLHAANGFSNLALANTAFESNAFYGELVNGIWTLHFFDFCAPSSISTTLSTTAPQSLAFYGH